MTVLCFGCDRVCMIANRDDIGRIPRANRLRGARTIRIRARYRTHMRRHEQPRRIAVCVVVATGGARRSTVIVAAVRIGSAGMDVAALGVGRRDVRMTCPQ